MFRSLKHLAISPKIPLPPLTSFRAALSTTASRVDTHTVGGTPVEVGGVRRNSPLLPTDAHWTGGIASFMRLPIQNTAEGLDACFVGVPLDIGTTHRSGTRFGPRQIRQESIGVRIANLSTKTKPFDNMNVADIGDIGLTMYNLPEAIEQISAEYDNILKHSVVPLTLGGDHTISYPILQAIAKKHGPVAVVHVDAHSDTTDTTWGAKISHATPFRRAVEEGLVLPHLFYQIGLRGSVYSLEDYDWAKQQGMTVILAEDCWHKSLTPLMDKIRKDIGDKPTYLTFDIDGIDPSFCPGTGTREVGGLTTIQALEIVRGCHGLNLVGADLVEVAPPYDMQGTTAHVAANLLFEMLCALPMNNKKNV